MANPSGTVTYRLSVVPKESVEQVSGAKSTTWSDVSIDATLSLPSESSTTSESIVWNDTGGIGHGYLNGAKYLAQVTTTSTNILGTGVAQVEFAYFKHTGYQFRRATATCALTNTDATVTCSANDFINVGMEVSSGSGITAGTTVASINTGTAGRNVTSFEMSAAATASVGAASVTFLDHANVSSIVSTDHLEIRGDSNSGFVVAVLKPGAAVALPVQSSSGWGTSGDRIGSTNYFFQSVDPDDIDDAGGNEIAMEFICVTHS